MKKVFTVGQEVYACSSVDDFELRAKVKEVQELKGDTETRIYKINKTWYKDDCVFGTYQEMKVAYAYYQSKNAMMKYDNYINETIRKIYDLAEILVGEEKTKTIQTTFFSVLMYDDNGNNATSVNIDKIKFTYIGVDDDNEPIFDILYYVRETNEWVEATEHLEDIVYILTIEALHKEFKKLISK
jgi:hypothetical protein